MGSGNHKFPAGKIALGGIQHEVIHTAHKRRETNESDGTIHSPPCRCEGGPEKFLKTCTAVAETKGVCFPEFFPLCMYARRKSRNGVFSRLLFS